jgi:GAF domain-containing protein
VINNVDESEELGPNRPLLQEFGVKTMMVVPMIVQGELIGSVSLDVYYGPRSFTLDEFESAMAITAQLAISVRNAQLYSRVKRQAEQLETIADLSRQISSTLDRRRIFQIVREGIPKLISTDLIGVALREANRSTLQLFILGDGDPSLTEFEANQTGLNLICNTAEPLVIDDISDADYPDYQLLAERGMHAALIVPLISGGNVVGALSVMSRQARAYAPSELSVVEQIGNQLVGALENARLYTQTSQRAETERLMNRLGSGVQGQDDMHRMLLTTVQDIADALGARRARVRLQTPPAQTMDAAKLASLSSRIADKLSRKREG